MRKLCWSLGVALAGVFLSMKDIDWTYDSTGHKVSVLVLYGVIGASIGLCLSIAADSAHTRAKRLARLFCWVGSFGFLGLALGHGNVPWLVTFRFIGTFAAIGVVIGSLQFLIASRSRV
jgi:hypothetical protein